MRTLLAVLCGAAVVAMACGDGTGPVANRGGTGTTTLLVTADIDADDTPGGYVTVFDVSVRSGAGAPISGATVTVRHDIFGTVTLPETGTGTGDYLASRNGYPTEGLFHLDVVRGSDNVRDVAVGSLGIHNITAPTAGSTVPANQPLVVRWTRPAAAQSADLETRDYSVQGLADNGTATIPGVNNPVKPDQRIWVFRNNQVNPTGGLGGSRLRLRLRDSVDPINVQ